MQMSESHSKKTSSKTTSWELLHKFTKSLKWSENYLKYFDFDLTNTRKNKILFVLQTVHFYDKPIVSFSFRSSRSEVFCEQGVLKNFAKFTGKHLRQSLFFDKVAGWGQQFYSKRDSDTGTFLRILRNF